MTTSPDIFIPEVTDLDLVKFFQMEHSCKHLHCIKSTDQQYKVLLVHQCNYSQQDMVYTMLNLLCCCILIYMPEIQLNVQQ